MLNDVSASADRDEPVPTRRAARPVVMMAVTIASALGGVVEIARANLEGISDHDFVIDWSDPTKGIDTGAEIVEGEGETLFGVRLLQDEFSVPVAEPLESRSHARSNAAADPIAPVPTAPTEVGKRQPQRFGFNAGFFTLGDFEYGRARRLMPPIPESSGNPTELTEDHSARVFRFAF